MRKRAEKITGRNNVETGRKYEKWTEKMWKRTEICCEMDRKIKESENK